MAGESKSNRLTIGDLFGASWKQSSVADLLSTSSESTGLTEAAAALTGDDLIALARLEPTPRVGELSIEDLRSLVDATGRWLDTMSAVAGPGKEPKPQPGCGNCGTAACCCCCCCCGGGPHKPKRTNG